jgi:uncharacterized protein (TIRG00374 family)
VAGTVESDHGHEQMPRVRFTRARLLASGLFVVMAVAFLYLVLPNLVGLHQTWNRLQQGNVWWLAVAFLLECLSFLGYVALFRAVFVEPAGAVFVEPASAGSIGDSAGAESPPRLGSRSRIDWRASYEITMAGLAATRLFAAAGAGGLALTAWALRRSGMARRIVACRMIAFTVLLYAVYMVTLVVDGVGLYLGVWPGSGPFAITMVPAIFAAVVIILFLAVSLLPGDADRLTARWAAGRGRVARIAQRLATVPSAAATGVRTARDLLRTAEPSLLGAIAWWGFDIATLWACFHAFGASPQPAVIVMAYFVGMLGNVLPLPGGIGGVDGGMIGAFSAFGVDVQTAIVAVLAYRAFAFWLPTLPGGVAYLQLRRTVHRWQAELPSGPAHEAAAGTPTYT